MYEKISVVYILASKRKGALYIGVTSNIVQRIYQHKNDVLKGFTKKYGCKSLVYFEILGGMEDAIAREKQIKNYSRRKKLSLIESMNPLWKCLYNNFL